jgi:hypothetical protein
METLSNFYGADWRKRPILDERDWFPPREAR